jgi:DNA-binding transcriptional regulator YdaS (Cro superfamily)
VTIQTIHRLEPAYTIVERLGGKSTVAESLGLDKSTLSRWCQRKPYGTGGVIPQRYWPKLLELARQAGVEVALEELASLEA